MAARCVLLLCALALLQVQCKPSRKCAYDASGDLVGYEVNLDLVYLSPKHNKVYQQEIQSLTGCDFNGVAVKVCDLFPPEVEINLNGTGVSVRRLGPRLLPLSLEVTLYCDPYPMQDSLE